MRKGKKKLWVLALVMGLYMVTNLGAAYALNLQIPELVVMKIGDPDQTREFSIDNTFCLDQFGPSKTFIYIALGDNSTDDPATRCGKLTLTLATTAKRDYSAEITFAIQGFAYGIGGKASIINANGTTPSKASKVVTFNTLYGVAFITAVITNINGGEENGQVELPAPFTIVFSLAKK